MCVFSILLLPMTAGTLFCLRARLPAWARFSSEVSLRRVILADWASYLICTPFLIAETVLGQLAKDHNCPPALYASHGDCAFRFLRTYNIHRGFKSVITQLPAALCVPIEAARGAISALFTLYIYWMEGLLTPIVAARVTAHTLYVVTLTLFLVVAHHDPVFADRYAPEGLDMCPRFLRPLRTRYLAALSRAARYVSPLPLDYRVVSGITICASMLASRFNQLPFIVFTTVGEVSQIIYLALTASALCAAWLTGGGTASLGRMARRLGMDREAALVESVRERLSGAATEQEALQVAANELGLLFPTAASILVGAAEAEGHIAFCAACAGEPLLEGPLRQEGTSVAFCTCQEHSLIADSRDFPDGLSTFSDWAFAAAAGAGVCITAPLTAGPSSIGFVCLRFSADAAKQPSGYEAMLLKVCSACGEFIYSQRQATLSSASHALAVDVFPQHVVERLLARSRRRTETPAWRAPPVQPPPEGAAAAARAASPSFAAVAARRQSIGSAADDASEHELARRSLRGIHAADAEEDDLLVEKHACVSIVFVDVVGFTALSESKPAEQTMQSLHALFSRFDDLVTELGLYKVETIGDCYMAVSGLLPKREDHAQGALQFALRTHQAARDCKLLVRAGMHAGSVTSGLIGRLRARFCIFGDAVNVASRMESTGVPGAVHLSRSSMALIVPAVDESLFEARTLEIKGKREPLETMLVRSEGKEAETLLAFLVQLEERGRGRGTAAPAEG